MNGWRISTLVCSFFLLNACSSEPYVPGADRVFTNGAVYTVNPHQLWATAVAIHNGRITYVGDDAGSEIHIGTDTEVIDLQGKMLMPGFIDSHMHPMAAGTRFLRCDLESLAWPEEVKDQLIACAGDVKPGKWLRGVNLDIELFNNGNLDNTLLQEWLPDMPVAITSFSGSEIWVSSSVLEIAGVGRNTPNKEKGDIVRNRLTGEPTGVLRKEAMGKIYTLIPLPDTDDLRLAFRKASELANSLGITTSAEAAMRPPLFEAFQNAEFSNEMTLRVFASQLYYAELEESFVQEIYRRRTESTGGLFQANSVKLFLDGNNNRTSALIEPYSGHPDDYGKLYFSNETLNALVQDLDANGMQVHMHAYGDAAVRQALDAIEQPTSGWWIPQIWVDLRNWA
jgi:predicted amidohydrolase YtcJ